MNTTLKKTISQFHSMHEDGRIICSVSELAHGITLNAQVYSGETLLAATSRFVPSGEQMSKLDICSGDIYDSVALDALALAGVLYIADTSSEPKERKARKAAKGAAPDEEPTGLKETPADEGKEPHEDESHKDSPAGPDVPSATDETEEEAKEMTEEEAKAVILELKARAKSMAESDLKGFIGKPVGELFQRRPSLVRMIAAQAVKGNSIAAPEAEAAILFLNSVGRRK